MQNKKDSRISLERGSISSPSIALGWNDLIALFLFLDTLNLPSEVVFDVSSYN